MIEGWNAEFEFKFQDFWIGVFWKRQGNCVDAWICFIPCVPLHISWWWTKDKPTLEGNEACLNHGDSERVRLKEEGMSSKEYWMIEKIIDGQAHWWIPDHSQSTHWDDPCRWTTDSSKARHYDCKSAAEYVMGDQMPGCFVTGHIDCDGPDMTLPFGD